jgi:hypothetical protein
MVSEDSHVTSVVLPLPIRECWPYFRDPALIREWHGWEYDGLAAEITEIFVDHARVSEDHRSISFGTHLFNFTEDDGVTLLEVHRAPLAEGSEWAPYMADIDEGWTSFVQQLRFKLQRHRDDTRHTIFYGGTPKDSTIAPVQRLGLGQVGLQEVGAAYGATVGPGDALTGEVWFVSDNQVGVTVDEWGDGLLVVTNGPAGGPPYTKGEAIITTYGLDEEQRAELTARWSEWWSGHY